MYLIACNTQVPAVLEVQGICASAHRVGDGKDWIGDAHSFVLPGFWDSSAGLVALVVACAALMVKFPLDLQFR